MENNIPALDKVKITCEIGERISGFKAVLAGESRGGYSKLLSDFTQKKKGGGRE